MSTIKMLAAAAVLATGLGAAASASAAPGAPAGLASDGLVTTVAQGCGPGGFRGPRGFCRGGYGPGPGFGPRRFYGGPRFYGRPRGYGPRPFYRY